MLLVSTLATVNAAAPTLRQSGYSPYHRENQSENNQVTGVAYAQRAPAESPHWPGGGDGWWAIHTESCAKIAAAVMCPTQTLGGILFTRSVCGTFLRDSRMLVGDIFAHTEMMAAPVLL